MNPDDYNFYRIDVGNEHVKGVLPTRMTYKRFRELVASPHMRVKVLAGRRVRNQYGTYWIEKKEN